MPRGYIKKRGRAAPKRPVDKLIVSINDQTVDGTQEEVLLANASTPCTAVGFRWSLSVRAGSTADTQFWWAIVRHAEGDSVNAFNTANAATLYAPEGEVIALGVGILQQQDEPAGPVIQHFEGVSKTSRKMMIGDKISLVRLSVGDAAQWTGAVTLFCLY